MKKAAKPEEEEKIVYSSYASLVDPGLTLEQLGAESERVLALLSAANWKANCEALERLRVFNKFAFDFLCSKLPNFNEGIKAAVDSLRSGIAKLGLIFLQELTSNPPDVTGSVKGPLLRTYLPLILPLLLRKNLDSKKFITNVLSACFLGVASILL